MLKTYGRFLLIHWSTVLTVLVLAMLIATVVSIYLQGPAATNQVAVNWDSGKPRHHHPHHP